MPEPELKPEQTTTTEEVVEPSLAEQLTDIADTPDDKPKVPAEKPAAEKTDETPPAEPAKILDEPIDNGARSHLGRLGKKVGSLENNFDSIMAKLDDIRTHDVKEPSAEIDFEIPTTQEEFNVLVDARQAEKEQVAKSENEGYVKNYLEAFKTEGGEDPMFEKIYEEMTTNFNNRHSDNGELDAVRNYYAARDSFKAKEAAKATNPIKGASLKTPMDKGDLGHIPARGVTHTKLEGSGLEYAQASGMSQESITAALSGSLPLKFGR